MRTFWSIMEIVHLVALYLLLGLAAGCVVYFLAWAGASGARRGWTATRDLGRIRTGADQRIPRPRPPYGGLHGDREPHGWKDLANVEDWAP